MLESNDLDVSPGNERRARFGVRMDKVLLEDKSMHRAEHLA